MASAWAPEDLSSSTAAADLAALRAAMTMRAPSVASPCAMPNPMPPLPPVITATLSCKSNIGEFLLV